MFLFFFHKYTFSGVAVLCSGVLGSSPVVGVVTADRSLPGGENWIDTGLKRLISFDIIDRTDDGNPLKINAIGSWKIFASDGDTISKYKDSAPDCDSALDTEDIFVLSLSEGLLDAEKVWIHDGTAPGLSVGIFCCE